MFENYIRQLGEDAKRVQIPLEPPATREQLTSLHNRVAKQFQVELPDPYVAILEQTNGLTRNGLHLYGATAGFFDTDGRPGIFEFVHANLLHRGAQGMENRLVFGTDPNLYLWDLEEGTFIYCDDFGADVMESFPTCEALLRFAFEQCLA
jgi:hypothetical protein